MDRVTSHPSTSASEIEPESSSTHADVSAASCRKLSDSVYELYSPSSADISIDIVFFHGLQLRQDPTPHLSTWRSRDAGSSIWPGTWLPEEYPTARILSVHYDGSMKKTDRDGRMDLYLIAESLLHELRLAGVGKSRPVILVGHSFGGLVIKRLCVLSSEKGEADASTFFDNIMGIFFYATPHQGSSRLENVEKFDTEDGELVSVLRVLNRDLARLNQDFEKLDNDFRRWHVDIASVLETLPADLDGERHIIVKEASARSVRGAFTALQEDHFSISQPRERTNTSYQSLVDFIRQVRPKMIDRFEDFGGDIQPLPKTRVGLLTSWHEGDIKRSLEQHQAIGLWGMGGIGKTTLAKAIFNQERTKFDLTVFVNKVKLRPGEEEEMEEVLFDHTFSRGKKVETILDMSSYRGKDVLVVLDDVHKDRDIAIIARLQYFCSPRSRFILTSRDRQIMQKVDSLVIVEITSLDEESSKNLFSSIAISEEETLQEWQKQCLKGIVRNCGGLPLILEVIGQYLKTTKERTVWEETLESLTKASDIDEDHVGIGEVLRKLKVSYDTLGEHEKEMFVDVATFFSGIGWRLWTLAEAKAAWSVSHGNENQRWKVLVDRALVYHTEDEDSEIKMHEHLQALGREIADRTNRRQRVTCANVNHISMMVHKKILQAQDLQQLLVLQGPSPTFWESFYASWMDTGEEVSTRFPCVQKEVEVISYGSSRRGILHSGCFSSVLQELKRWIPRFLFSSIGSFHKMQELRYLHILSELHRPDTKAVKLKLPSSLLILQTAPNINIDSFSFQSNMRLAVLSLGYFRGRYLPDSFSNLKDSLQFLSLNAPNLKSLPESFSHLRVLRECILKCPLVRKLPESFGSLSALRNLKLESFYLGRLPNSFCRLRELQVLELFECQNFEELPIDFGHLENIQRLIISNYFQLDVLEPARGLAKLHSLPDSLGNLQKLQILTVKVESLKELPVSLGGLEQLRKLIVKSRVLQELPHSLGNLGKLQTLEVYSESLKVLPVSIGGLEHLNKLTVKSSVLQQLPSSLCNLKNLKQLTVHCKALEHLPTSLNELQDLEVRNVYNREWKVGEVSENW